MAIALVGGVESIVIDGKRWFFGFDYKGDRVISPLIDDPDMMTAFASRYMLQRDGVHGREYWRARVEESIGSSELTGDVDTQHTFATSEFRRIASELAAAEAGNRSIPDLIQYNVHYLYLLEAAARDKASPPDDPAYASAIRKLGLTEDDSTLVHALAAMEMLADIRPLLGFATYADAAAAARVCLTTLVKRASGNWRTLFQGLIAP